LVGMLLTAVRYVVVVSERMVVVVSERMYVAVRFGHAGSRVVDWWVEM